MPTRLYQTGVAPPFSPTPDAAWEVTTGPSFARSLLSRNSALVAAMSSSSNSNGVNGNDTVEHQLLFGPLAAQTISGTIKGQVGAREAAANINACMQAVIRVISPAGVVRGTLLAEDTSALSNEFFVDTIVRNIKFPRNGSKTLTAVAAEDGDYVVIEVGFRNYSANVGSTRVNLPGGTTADLPEDETTTPVTGYRSWFEFSGDLLLSPGSLAGASNNSGALASQKIAALALAGASNNSGALTRKVNTSMAGASSNAGTLTGPTKLAAAFELAMSGASTNSGALAFSLLRALAMAGASNNSGALAREIAKSFTGASTNSGAFARALDLRLAFSGASNNSGALNFIRAIAFAGFSSNEGNLDVRKIPPPLVFRIARRLVQMHAFLYGQNASGGPGTLKRDLTPYLLNTFWQRSMNLAGRAAFALPRSSELNNVIVPGVDHLMLWRETPDDGPELVFQGKIADTSIIVTDVVWQAFDYLSYLQRSRAGYRTLYPEKNIGSEIISPEWLLARNANRSPLAFVTTGTIQNPLGIDGVTPVKTNTKFGLMMQDRLFLFYALAEMAMVNTTNNVVFEITLNETAPQFNFWRNRGTQKTDPVLSWPGNLTAFSYAPGYLQYVNDLASVVKKATGGGQEEYQLDATDLGRDAALTTYRRLQQAVSVSTLAGLASAGTESDQMKAAVNRMLVDSMRLPKMFVAIPRMNEIKPFDGWDLGDKLMVFVQKAGDEDTDEVSQYLRVVSVAAAWRPDAGEGMQLYLRGEE